MSFPLDFQGRVFATPSAATIIVDGVEIHSGQVGAGQPLDTVISLTTLANVTANTTLSASIAVTSGLITVGQVIEDDGDINTSVDLRDDILINGVAPDWPATPVVPMPGGSEESPVWTGWFFEVGAGETITFNIDVPDVGGNVSPT